MRGFLFYFILFALWGQKSLCSFPPQFLHLANLRLFLFRESDNSYLLVGSSQGIWPDEGVKVILTALMCHFYIVWCKTFYQVNRSMSISLPLLISGDDEFQQIRYRI